MVHILAIIYIFENTKLIPAVYKKPVTYRNVRPYIFSRQLNSKIQASFYFDP